MYIIKRKKLKMVCLFFIPLIHMLCCSSLTADDKYADKKKIPSPVSYQLVDENRVLCEIILSDNPTEKEKKSAEALQDILYKSTGKKIIIIEEKQRDKNSSLTGIYIGKTKFALENVKFSENLKLDTFIIKPLDAHNLILSTARSERTPWAVGEFLEKYIGAMWIWPSKYGTVIPKHQKLIISVKEELKEPVFDTYFLSDWGSRDFGFSKCLNKWPVSGTYYVKHDAHAIYQIFPPEKYLNDHPEYYALINGKRLRPTKEEPSYWQVCTSNPEVIDIAVKAAEDYFKQFPDRSVFSLGHNDGGGFCKCAKCKALDIPGKPGVSDRYFAFANAVAEKVAKTYPDKYILVMAYNETKLLPEKSFRFHKNIKLLLVIPTLDGDAFEKVKKWVELCPNFGVYFWIHGKPIPKFYFYRFAEYLRFLHETGCSFIYLESRSTITRGYYASYYLDAPKFYILHKLLANPDEDVNALMKKFCQAFYQEGAGDMMQFYDKLASVWEQSSSDKYDFGKKWQEDEAERFGYEEIDELRKYVAKALQKARDEEVQMRLKFLDNELERASIVVKDKQLGIYLDKFKIEKNDASIEKIISPIEEYLKNRNAFTEKNNTLSRQIPYFTENIIYKKLDQIASAIGDKKAILDFEILTEKYPEIAKYLKTEIAILKNKGKERKNLLLNPGFEEINDGSRKNLKSDEVSDDWLENKKIPSWWFWNGQNSNGVADLASTASIEGRYSAVIKNCVSGCMVQAVRVVPEETINISASFKAKADPGSTQRVAIVIGWKDKNGKWTEVKSNIKIDLPSDTEGKWQPVSQILTVPPNVNYLSISLSTRGQFTDDAVWFDNVKIEKIR